MALILVDLVAGQDLVVGQDLVAGQDLVVGQVLVAGQDLVVAGQVLVAGQDLAAGPTRKSIGNQAFQGQGDLGRQVHYQKQGKASAF